MKNNLTILVAEEGLCAVLQAALAVYGLGLDVCAPGEEEPEAEIIYPPEGQFRLGEFLDDLTARMVAGAALLQVGPWTLDSQNLIWRRTEGPGEDIRLTEKERDILVALHEKNGAVMERAALLEAVWGYVDGIETHTLETHIYRLRQKIEEDPARPMLLLTEGSGYRLVLDR